MKRGTLVFCVLMMLVLSACGADRDTELLSRITARYAAVPDFDARTAVRVELPDRAMDFVIDWHLAAGTGTLTVAEPAQIAGLSCETDDMGLHFRYAGAVLTLDPSGGRVSPLEALSRFPYDWAGGQVQDCCRETRQGAEALAVTYERSQGGTSCVQRVWFDTERLTPLFSEYYEDGTLVLSCEFLLFHPELS